MAAGKRLSGREAEVLGLIADGYEMPGIAVALNVSQHTARCYRARLFAKLGAHTAAQAVHLAYRRGDLLGPEDLAAVAGELAEDVAVVLAAREMGYRIALVPVARGVE